MANSLFTPTKHSSHCPQCGAQLAIKQGKKGLFLGCSAYPQCDYLHPLQPAIESKIIKQLTELCPQCGKLLVLKRGHFGMFIGCSGYPACDFIAHDEPKSCEEAPITCPECQKGLLVARRGRQGKSFYACNQFPQCKFTLNSQPYPQPCPHCNYPLSLAKKTGGYQCANKQCKQSFTIE